jgi:hypothetical protein
MPRLDTPSSPPALRIPFDAALKAVRSLALGSGQIMYSLHFVPFVLDTSVAGVIIGA